MFPLRCLLIVCSPAWFNSAALPDQNRQTLLPIMPRPTWQELVRRRLTPIETRQLSRMSFRELCQDIANEHGSPCDHNGKVKLDKVCQPDQTSFRAYGRCCLSADCPVRFWFEIRRPCITGVASEGLEVLACCHGAHSINCHTSSSFVTTESATSETDKMKKRSDTLRRLATALMDCEFRINFAALRDIDVLSVTLAEATQFGIDLALHDLRENRLPNMPVVIDLINELVSRWQHQSRYEKKKKMAIDCSVVEEQRPSRRLRTKAPSSIS